MMHSYYYDTSGPWGSVAFGNPAYVGGLGPFALGAMIVGGILGIIWLIVTIWALVDLFKNKPPHTTAWAFVILLGKIMGPIGYYFIVVKDRDSKKNTPSSQTNG
jgi:hypothetical protein